MNNHINLRKFTWEYPGEKYLLLR